MPLPSPGPERTCVITGASSGIGAEIARELARRGHGLVLVARRQPMLRALADELTTGSDIRVETVALDLADADARAELLPICDRLGLVADVLVNNAGFSTLGPVHRARRPAEIALVRTDVEAVVDLCTMFSPAMVARGEGAILNTASTAAFLPLPGQAAYGAAKAFVLSYTHALRAELRRYGVAVTALCPGPVATGFAAAAGASTAQMADALPRLFWRSATEVARAGVDGLAQDRAVPLTARAAPRPAPPPGRRGAGRCRTGRARGGRRARRG